MFFLVYVKAILQGDDTSKKFYETSIRKIQNSEKEECLGPLVRRANSTPYSILIEIIRTVLKRNLLTLFPLLKRRT